ncbi:MAG: hypothetical protein HYS89_01315 [Candidatus Colwellbacteria bacterium]|nr:hypothetical protein [Candidatus Colwellbacteria bacterium]
MKETLLLIDANSLIHRAFHALPPFTSSDGSPTGALYGLSAILIKVLRERPPEYALAAFDRDDTTTIRATEYKEYKGKRPPTAEPLVAQLLLAPEVFSAFGIKTLDYEGWEADDIVATLAERFKGKENLTIIALSGDADLFQLVEGDKVVVETIKKGVSETIIYNEAAVKERFGLPPTLLADYKGLAGDVSDNIPGVPGVGPKTATKILVEHGSLEKVLEEAESIGLTDTKLQQKLVANKDQALLSKKLATLNRSLPLEVELEDLRVKSIPKEETANYLEGLGFGSLAGRLLKPL